MIAARQIFLGRGGAKLPYDAEVEYLRAVGTSTDSPWIDTGFHIIDGDEIFMKIIAPLSASNFAIGSVIFSDFFTTSLNGGGVGIGRFSGPPVRGYFLGKYESTSVANYGKGLLSLTLNSNALTVSIGDTDTAYNLIDLSSYEENRGTLGLFGCSQRTTHPVYDFSCVQFTIKRNGQHVCNLNPVRFTNELGQSEGAMYDRVSGQLFRNQGTGAFIIGNDK